MVPWGWFESGGPLSGATCGRTDVVWVCINHSASSHFYDHRRPSTRRQHQLASIFAAVFENVNPKPLLSREMSRKVFFWLCVVRLKCEVRMFRSSTCEEKFSLYMHESIKKCYFFLHIVVNVRAY